LLLGAHVSTAGGVRNAPGRAAEIGASAVQIFTKQPSRWAEPALDLAEAEAFRAGLRAAGVRFACSHDSYLINLASPDPVLRDRSFQSFVGELRRARLLGLDAVVSHPGNLMGSEREAGLAQNAALIQRAMADSDATSAVLLETTAGAGTVLGSTFQEIARIIDAIDPPFRDRVGVCLDTCHVFAAGYDLPGDYDAVFAAFQREVGLERLLLFHLNDSLKPLGSRVDRHAGIGEGMLGTEPFRRIMNDPRFRSVPRVLETPKGDDPATMDRLNLLRLRELVAPDLAPEVAPGGPRGAGGGAPSGTGAEPRG
jgi:deoxyribonuclease IV